MTRMSDGWQGWARDDKDERSILANPGWDLNEYVGINVLTVAFFGGESGFTITVILCVALKPVLVR
ncbi:MAG TPA: hypothetical protein VEH81_01590 [Ktedonobacteraceae bacterium]|nr:hypothetical protein [Ktedonobacteraceae bacterium]